MRTALAVAIAATVVALAGCASESETTTAPSSSTAPSSTTAAASPTSPAESIASTTAPASNPAAPAPASGPAAAMRTKTCRDILPLLDQLRAVDPAAAVQSAESTIANLPATPEWPTLSDEERAAAIAGIRDAAAGSCS
ncbi:hypothetical protein [Nocardia farcinica]|uniref:hypothetical protein n=1 Tax=Nocardia farcinica TaxID=37329 RepID=UPI001894FEFD|nr:hypothetical protein [Nocardia farcinica]MBF6411183.1 hypothetical protein [Nocardia farcinica]